jgi:hypothetical protein
MIERNNRTPSRVTALSATDAQASQNNPVLDMIDWSHSLSEYLIYSTLVPLLAENP